MFDFERVTPVQSGRAGAFAVSSFESLRLDDPVAPAELYKCTEKLNKQIRSVQHPKQTVLARLQISPAALRKVRKGLGTPQNSVGVDG